MQELESDMVLGDIFTITIKIRYMIKSIPIIFAALMVITYN